MNKSLTIVLPVYNAESRLQKSVVELLELASELTAKFGVLVIDDGSTDATCEVAEELAARYPQVSVRRHRHRLGLGAAIEYVRHRVRSDAVLVHDGVSPIDANQLRTMWRGWHAQLASHENEAGGFAALPQEALDFGGSLAAIHAAVERAHGRVLGFQLLPGLEAHSALSDDRSPAAANEQRADSPHDDRGVGRIPPLPRPKFLSALADFALGE